MSIQNKPGGGSRASDEDGKTSVRVGKEDGLIRSTSRSMLILLPPYSRPSSASFEVDGSRLRSHSAAISAIYGPSHLAYELVHRVSARTQIIRL